MVTIFPGAATRLMMTCLAGLGSQIGAIPMAMLTGVLDHVQQPVSLNHGRVIKVLSYCQHQGQCPAKPAGPAAIRIERAVRDFLALNLQVDLHHLPTGTR